MAESLPEEIDPKARTTLLASALDMRARIYNHSRFTLEKLKGKDAKQLCGKLTENLPGFSPKLQDIVLEMFSFPELLKQLDDASIQGKDRSG